MNEYTMNDLIEELNRLWALPDDKFHTVGSHTYLNDNQEGASVCDDAETMCDRLLIKRGSPKWENIKILKTHGYDVHCTERDSFGWLGAAIIKDKKTMYFG